MNTDFARQQMIRQQVRAWNVLDARVLSGMNDIPRELFVPAGYEALAFADAEIPLGHGQKMMTPTLEGRVLQALELCGDEHVLEIGTGSGFLTACLATLSAAVTSIDVFKDFHDRAREHLAVCGIDNVDLLQMDGTEKLPDAKFDAIAVTGSLQAFDHRFVAALKPGGRLFVIVGDAPAMSATRVTLGNDDTWQSDTLFETDIAPLINGASARRFSF